MDQASLLRQLTRHPKGADAEMPKAKAADPKHSYVISVTSGKGGVGKTNIAANIAYLLSAKKKKTLIIDADCGLANIDLLLGLTPRFNLSHVLKGEKSLQEILVVGPGGIRILPSSSGIQEMSTLSREQKLALQDELQALSFRPDFVLIDTSAGISDNVMYFNMVAGEIIVVVTPEPTSIADAYALIKLLSQRHAKKRFKLIVNQARSREEAREVFLRMAQATNHFLSLAIEQLGYVVSDDHVVKAVRQQRLLAEIYPEAPAIQCLKAVADQLIELQGESEDRGIMSLFNGYAG